MAVAVPPAGSVALSKSLVYVPGTPCFVYSNMPGYYFQLPKVTLT